MDKDHQTDAESNSKCERELINQTAQQAWIIRHRLSQRHHVGHPINHLAFTFSLNSLAAPSKLHRDTERFDGFSQQDGSGRGF
jgi:hypothetical protein